MFKGDTLESLKKLTFFVTSINDQRETLLFAINPVCLPIHFECALPSLLLCIRNTDRFLWVTLMGDLIS